MPIAFVVVGSSSLPLRAAAGCAERKTSCGLSGLEERYDRMVLSWSAFGGDSTTSRLKVSGAALSFVGG